jgi:hypothetical protein
MSVYTICFCGTDCWPDEGLLNSKGSGPALYGDNGYIPVKVFADIVEGGDQAKLVVPGAGKPWDALKRKLWVRDATTPSFPMSLVYDDTKAGLSIWDLVGHAAANVINVNDPKQSFNQLEAIVPHQGSQVKAINLIGHSRGGVEAIMAAHVFQKLLPAAEVRIFAIDPVPGTGGWTEDMTTLPPNVKEYVGVYAVDETSDFFNAVVPWTNGTPTLDPLAPVAKPGDPCAAVNGYELVFAPGRHATVAGNRTSNGKDDPKVVGDPKFDPYAAVGALVSDFARRKLQHWGTKVPLLDANHTAAAKAALKDPRAAALFADMRQYTYSPRDLHSPFRCARGVSSTYGRFNTGAWCYLEDAAGIPPLPIEKVTAPAQNKGKVGWTSLVDAWTKATS